MLNSRIKLPWKILFILPLLITGCSYNETVKINAEELKDYRNNQFKSVELTSGEKYFFIPETFQYLQFNNGAIGRVYDSSATVVPLHAIKSAVTSTGTLTGEELAQSDTSTILQITTTYDKNVYFKAEPPAKYYTSVTLLAGLDTSGTFRIINEKEIKSAEFERISPLRVVGSILFLGAAAYLGTGYYILKEKTCL